MYEHRDESSSFISVVKWMVVAEPIQQRGGVGHRVGVLEYSTNSRCLPPHGRLEKRQTTYSGRRNRIVGKKEISDENLVYLQYILGAESSKIHGGCAD
jgi:hypothetical protein